MYSRFTLLYTWKLTQCYKWTMIQFFFMVLGSLTTTCKRINLDLNLMPFKKSPQNELETWIKTWNYKTLRQKYRGKLLDICLGSDFFVFFDLTLKVRQQKKKINKWDYIKTKIFYMVKEAITKTKRQCIEWKQLVVNHIFNKRLISKI